jgi:hypothetical protein
MYKPQCQHELDPSTPLLHTHKAHKAGWTGHTGRYTDKQDTLGKAPCAATACHHFNKPAGLLLDVWLHTRGVQLRDTGRAHGCPTRPRGTTTCASPAAAAGSPAAAATAAAVADSASPAVALLLVATTTGLYGLMALPQDRGRGGGGRRSCRTASGSATLTRRLMKACVSRLYCAIMQVRALRCIALPLPLLLPSPRGRLLALHMAEREAREDTPLPCNCCLAVPSRQCHCNA